MWLRCFSEVSGFCIISRPLASWLIIFFVLVIAFVAFRLLGLPAFRLFGFHTCCGLRDIQVPAFTAFLALGFLAPGPWLLGFFFGFGLLSFQASLASLLLGASWLIGFIIGNTTVNVMFTVPKNHVITMFAVMEDVAMLCGSFCL